MSVVSLKYVYLSLHHINNFIIYKVFQFKYENNRCINRSPPYLMIILLGGNIIIREKKNKKEREREREREREGRAE